MGLSHFVKDKKVHIVVEFGCGDLFIQAFEANSTKDSKRIVAVGFENGEPGEVGREVDRELTFPPPLCMTFPEVESIDVVIGLLEKAKKHLNTIREEEETNGNT